MNQKNQCVLVEYWADNHLVVSDNHYRLIDNSNQKNLFEFAALSVTEAKEKTYQFLRYGRVV